jgi:hypothetical protein
VRCALGQSEVLKYLKDVRKVSDRYLTIAEIKSDLSCHGVSVKNLYDHLYRLEMFGFITVKKDNWYSSVRLFRAKVK